jgi:hypothetical protein
LALSGGAAKHVWLGAYPRQHRLLVFLQIASTPEDPSSIHAVQAQQRWRSQHPASAVPPTPSQPTGADDWTAGEFALGSQSDWSMLLCSREEGGQRVGNSLLKGRSQVGEEALNREHLSARQKITTCTSRCSSYSSCSSCTLTTYQQAPHNRERRFNRMVTIMDGPRCRRREISVPTPSWAMAP